jgi:hypothetical protein
MQELKIEDVERIIGRIILGNYKLEEQYQNQIEMLTQELQRARTSDTLNVSNQPT